MDFKLNDDQREFQEKTRRFAREVMRPIAAQHDRDESVPWEAIKAAREWGLHGLETIQRMGEDPDGILSCIYAEEMHWGCAGIALAIQGGSLAAAGIASSGTPEQIGRWVPAPSPSRAPARTCARCAPPRSRTATSGCWAAPRSSSRTAASPT